MKHILFIALMITSFLSTAQTLTIVGDSLRVTIPVQVRPLEPIEPVYDGYIRDSVNMVSYIADLQKQLVSAQADLDSLRVKIAFVRTKARQIKGEREDREFLQGDWVLTTTNGAVVTDTVTITNRTMTDGTRTGTINFPTRTTFRVVGFFATAVIFTKVEGKPEFKSGARLTLTKPGR